MLLCTFSQSLLGIVAAFSPNIYMFTALRLMIGLFAVGGPLLAHCMGKCVDTTVEIVMMIHVNDNDEDACLSSLPYFRCQNLGSKLLSLIFCSPMAHQLDLAELSSNMTES